MVELRRHGESRERVDVPNVVERVAEEAVAIRPPHLADLLARDEFAIWASQAERLDRLLEPVTRQPSADIVALNLLVGVDDMATVDVCRAEGVGERARL